MNDIGSTSSELQALAGAQLIIYGIVFLALIALQVYMYCKVSQKAGYPAAYGLLMFVPIVSFIVILVFVFKEWPVQTMARNGGGSYSSSSSYTGPPYGTSGTSKPLKPSPYGGAPISGNNGNHGNHSEGLSHGPTRPTR